MSASTSHASYDDCFQTFDEAMEQPNGIRVEVPTENEGMQLFTRLHFARSMDRDNNKKIYEGQPGHKLFGTSVYDPLVVRKPKFVDERWWVYIEPRKINGRIEAL